MQFKSQIVVLGAKASKGEFNGRPFDSTTVYYQADLQDGENFAGQVGAEIKWGTSFNFEKMSISVTSSYYTSLCINYLGDCEKFLCPIYG